MRQDKNKLKLLKSEHNPSPLIPDSPTHVKTVVGQARDMGSSSQRRADICKQKKKIKVRVMEPTHFLKMCSIMSKDIISQMRGGLIIGPRKKVVIAR